MTGVIFGVLVLFVGLAGGILLYKSATSEKRREIYLGGGFGLIVSNIIGSNLSNYWKSLDLTHQNIDKIHEDEA